MPRPSPRLDERLFSADSRSGGRLCYGARRSMPESLPLLPLIAELGFSTAEQLGEAQARQLIYGGDQETNLLELGLVSESQLLAALSQATGLPPAPEGYLPVDPTLTSQIRSADVAALAGFDEESGYRLFVHEPLGPEQVTAVRDLLGQEVRILVASQLRMDEGSAYATGTLVEKRKASLLRRFGPRPPEEETARLPAATASASTENSSAESAPVESRPLVTENAPPPLPVADKEPIHETGPPPQDYDDIAAQAKRHKESLAERTSPQGSASPRNTYTFKEASDDLAAARTRERVIDVLVHFAAQFFDYTAVFAIVDQHAKGLKASGDGARSQDVEKLKIPLDLPSSFREAQATKTHRIGRLRASGLEGGVARDLKRPTGREMFLLPILVRGRTVLLLWGDSGNENVDISLLGELFSFAPSVSETLERVLIERIRASRVAEPVDARLVRPKEPQEEPIEAPPPLDAPTPALSAPPSSRLGEAKRRTTQRNSAAPAASPGLSPDAPRAGETIQEPETPASHEGVPAQVRAFSASSPPSESESEPPISFPAEPPKTIQGFPQAKLPADLAHIQITDLPPPRSPEPAQRAPLLSRRIVPLESVSGTPEASPQRHPVVAEAPPPPATTQEEAPPPPALSPIKEKPALRSTMMSRRPLISEPSESGWESPPAPVVRKVEGAANRPPKTRNYTEMVHRLIAGEESMMDALTAGGETAVGALIAEFPGPVTEPTAPQEKASDCGPVLRALVAMGSIAIPFLTVRTADGDPHVRRWATFVLGELPGKEAAKAIAGRLLDDAPQVRRAALSSARRAGRDVMTRRTLRSHIEALCRDRKLPSEARCSAVEALADIREHESIPTLLQLLEEEDRALLRGVRWALSVLTRQNFGEDDAAWQKFWQDHRDEDRAEWLIASLNHEDRDIRKAAADELRAMAGNDFGFQEDQADSERRTSQAAFREWWHSQGKKAN